MSFDPLRLLGITPTFRFVVIVDGIPAGVFTECGLPAIEWEVEEVKEGGMNAYVHQLPGRRKSTKVTLKNGVGVSPILMMWYIENLTEQFRRHNVTITLLNSLFIPIMVLNIEDAFPTKWTGPQLKTDDNTIALQTLELACGEITMIQV